jgi:short-subunit dehydrogenase
LKKLRLAQFFNALLAITRGMKLDGRTALVTGATGGLGRAIAQGLAARRARLVLTGRRAAVLEPLARDLGARALVVDLADRAALDRLLDEARDVDILVANAALPASGRITDLGDAEIDRALDVNLRAPIFLARALALRMAARGGGHIVFINSLSGKVAAPRRSLYSATKFGLRGFALGLRADLYGSGVGVSAIFPGFIRDAGMFADSGATLPAGVGTRAPEDVAAAVVRAIERDEAEIDVAPLGLRLGALLTGLTPGLGTIVGRWLGAERIADDVARGQRGKT